MESFRSKSKNEGKYEFWPPGLVQFYPPQLCAHIFVTVYQRQPVSCLLRPFFFLPVSKENLYVSTAVMLYTDDTLTKAILAWKYNIHLCKSHCSWRWLFLKSLMSTSGQRQVSLLCYVSQITTHLDYDQANKLVLVRILILRFKALY